MSTWRLLGNNDELEDTGIITNESLLPIRRIFTPDPKSVGRWFEFKLGTLECTKETFKCPMGFVKCRNSYCIGVELMCDGVKHCAGGEDEMNCENSTCPGLLRCKDSSVCLDVQNVCDGIKDCPNNEDEFFCTIKCPLNCTCDGLSLDCPAFVSQHINIIPKSARKLNLRYSDFSLNLPLLDDFRTLAELNMTYCGVSNLPPYFFSNLSNLYSLDMSHNNISTLVSYTFYGLGNLKSLILYGNSDLANIEPRAFIGMSKLSHLSIKNTRLSVLKRETFIGLDSLLTIDLSENMIKAIEDDTFFSLSTVKSLDVTNNRIEDFSNGIFNGLSTLETLHTDAFVFCCLKPKTVSSDMCFPKEDEFSSCDDLMRNDVLRWFLWIIGVSALLGNFGVIIYRLTFDRATLKKGHGILIANLGVSDFFMGVYLLIIASSDLYFRGRYIWNDLSWRRGGICKFAGVMSTIASECSVIFLCFITIDRIIAVRFPFGQYRITQKKALVACGIAWGVIFLLAVVPLIPSSYFMGQFYSRSAVCLALPLTRDKPAGWEYGTAIFIIFNFLVFIKIAFGQITIYREISAAMDAKIRSQRKNQDVAIARGLFMVVLTDFICWFPVGVMGIMALSGKAIPGEVYAWTAVFILPINSALNPFLYTFSTIIKQRVRFIY
ncbi:hypothetical protein FSP39_018119 [Pinctada imbricata]|uniref:G-protein coupled receptors family 1 profile domain-containing protein n=1 Tax=Pinctada imbricata TaxID=66713 RepID=A0AA88YF92_PINIB|nr:hypothetical protein FSP39_018119 [Pinctada imbricata]